MQIIILDLSDRAVLYQLRKRQSNCVLCTASKAWTGSGNYTITKIGDNQALAKVCYYGTDAAGSESFFANKHTDFSEGKRFIIIHMAASYANGSSDAFYGTNVENNAPSVLITVVTDLFM